MKDIAGHISLFDLAPKDKLFKPGDWHGKSGKKVPYEPYAWQPLSELPESYQPKGE